MNTDDIVWNATLSKKLFKKPRDALPRWLRHPRAAFQRHPDTERTGTLRDVAQRHPQLCHAAPCLQSGHQTGQTERRINRNLYTKIIRRRNVFRSAANDFSICGKRFSVCRRFFQRLRRLKHSTVAGLHFLYSHLSTDGSPYRTLPSDNGSLPLLPSSESEFQRGHAVGSHRQRLLHGLSGLLLERAERHGRRTAGQEVQSHSLFLVRHGTQTDNHLVVFPRGFQHGDVHGTVVYRHNRLHVRVLVRSDMHQRVAPAPDRNGWRPRRHIRHADGCGNGKPPARPASGEIRVPMVVHRPGIHRGRRFQPGQPRPLSAPSQRNVGRAVAILEQGGHPRHTKSRRACR